MSLAPRQTRNGTGSRNAGVSGAPQVRTLPWDWYPGSIPGNVTMDETAHLETTYSFLLYRSELPEGVRIGRGSTLYLGTMFDLGPRARVRIGDYALVHRAWFICDGEVE